MLIFIPGNVPSSKNGRSNTKTGMSFASPATTKWRKSTKMYWALLRKTFAEQCIGKSQPLFVGIHFIRKTRHNWDFINPCETIQDEMTHQGWISDDNVHNIFPVPMTVEGKLWSHDPENPGVLIHVLSSISEAEFSFSKSSIHTL